MMHKRISRLAVCFILLAYVSGCAIFSPSHHATEDYTPFFAAVSAGDLTEVKRDVEATPALVKATEWDNATPLHDAVGQNRKDVAAYLLDKGAQINAVTKDGLTPLHMAAQNGNIPMIVLLIENGAAVNAEDAKGWTPLDRASKWEHPDAAAFLSEHGGHQ
jgi:ankyrin repeat protein